MEVSWGGNEGWMVIDLLNYSYIHATEKPVNYWNYTRTKKMEYKSSYTVSCDDRQVYTDIKVGDGAAEPCKWMYSGRQ